MQAILKNWKHWMKEEVSPEFRNWYQRYSVLKSSVKLCYHNLNKDSELLQSTVIKWQKAGLEEMTLPVLEKTITSINRISIYTKMCSFHYRFLTKAIIVNIHLAKYKIKSTNLCTFCEIETETITHLFKQCQCVKGLWTQVERWINVNIPAMNKLDFILNRIKDNPRHVENMIIVAGKMFTYQCKCKQESPSYQKFKIWIENLYEIENKIARRNNKLDIHDLKWNNIKF